MSQSKSVVVVEGQMDLCMSYQAGVHNTVAVSGTAFTDEHIHIIKRFCDTVILSFDTDIAGQNALKKTALLCLLGGLDVYVVGDIGTKDPADLIKESPSAWIGAVNNKRHVIEVMLGKIIHDEKDTRIQGQKIVSDVLPFVRAIQSPIDRAHFIKVISAKTSIPESTLVEELTRGVTQIAVEEKEEVRSIPSKERLIREIIAFVTLTNMTDSSYVKELLIDMTQFPEAIIQEEMFKLEEKVIGDKEKYLKDLITSYKKELHKEQLLMLQSALKEEGADHEKILQEIEAHMKRGY
jgi:DNA primase